MEEIIEFVKQNHGATVINGALFEAKKGYQIAIGSEKQYKRFGWLVKKITGLKSYGLWYDKGIWYLDVDVIYTKSLKVAKQLAEKHNQKAIFNWSSKNSIYLSA